MIENKYWNEKIETIDRADLEELQLESLKEMIKFSYDNSVYYLLHQILLKLDKLLHLVYLVHQLY